MIILKRSQSYQGRSLYFGLGEKSLILAPPGTSINKSSLAPPSSAPGARPPFAPLVATLVIQFIANVG